MFALLNLTHCKPKFDQLHKPSYENNLRDLEIEIHGLEAKLTHAFYELQFLEQHDEIRKRYPIDSLIHRALLWGKFQRETVC